MLCLQYARKDIHPKKLIFELSVALPAVRFEIVFNPDTIQLCTFASLSEPDKVAVDGVVDTHDPSDVDTVEDRPPA